MGHSWGGGGSPSVGRAPGAGLGKGSPLGSTVVSGQGRAAPARQADLASLPFVPFPSTEAAHRKELGKPRW